MEASTQTTGFAGSIPPSDMGGQWTDDMDLERAKLWAGCELKRIVCSRLLGEISDEQYDIQKSRLLERYRILVQAADGLGLAWPGLQ